MEKLFLLCHPLWHAAVSGLGEGGPKTEGMSADYVIAVTA